MYMTTSVLIGASVYVIINVVGGVDDTLSDCEGEKHAEILVSNLGVMTSPYATVMINRATPVNRPLLIVLFTIVGSLYLSYHCRGSGVSVGRYVVMVVVCG